MDTKAIKQTENDLTAVKNFLENCRKLYRTEPIEIDEKEFLHIEGLGLCENCYELPNGRIFQGSPELQLGLKGYFIKVADKHFTFIDDPYMTADEVLEKINTSLKLKR